MTREQAAHAAATLTLAAAILLEPMRDVEAIGHRMWADDAELHALRCQLERSKQRVKK